MCLVVMNYQKLVCLVVMNYQKLCVPCCYELSEVVCALLL